MSSSKFLYHPMNYSSGYGLASFQISNKILCYLMDQYCGPLSAHTFWQVPCPDLHVPVTSSPSLKISETSLVGRAVFWVINFFLLHSLSVLEIVAIFCLYFSCSSYSLFFFYHCQWWPTFHLLANLYIWINYMFSVSWLDPDWKRGGKRKATCRKN